MPRLTGSSSSMISIARTLGGPETGPAGDGPRRTAIAARPRPPQPHQDFGRGADHMKIGEIEIEHVGRGIERAQRAIKRQGRGTKALRHPLGRHHLPDVALVNVVLRTLHRSLISPLAKT